MPGGDSGLGFGGVQTETALLRGAGGDAGTGGVDLQTMMDSLMNELEPLVTRWQGMTGKEFQKVRMKCDMDMKALTGALRAIGVKLEGSSNAYLTVDDTQAVDMASVEAVGGDITNALCGISADGP
jgi:WXG100 family type VII secretion target